MTMVAGFVCRGCHTTWPSAENQEVDTAEEASQTAEGICPECDDGED